MSRSYTLIELRPSWFVMASKTWGERRINDRSGFSGEGGGGGRVRGEKKAGKYFWRSPQVALAI